MTIRNLIPRRRWLLRLGVLVALGIGFCVGMSAYFDWRARQEWAEACVEADRLDPGWRWDVLTATQPSAPEGRNSAEHVAAAATFLPIISKTGGSAYPDFGQMATSFHGQNRLPAKALADIAEMLGDAANAFAEIDQIRGCPRGRIAVPADYLFVTAWPRPFESFDVIRRLVLPRLAVRAEKGDVDGALDDFHLMLLIAGPPADAPVLMVDLVAAADRTIAAGGLERVLAQGEPSSAALDAARRLAEMEAARPTLLPAFRGDRAAFESILHALDDGRLSRDEVAKSGLLADPIQLTGWKKGDEWLTQRTGADLRRSKGLSLFKHYTQLIEWLKQSPDGLKVHEAEWDAIRSRMTGAAKMWADSLTRAVADVRAADARFRCAAPALAAERYRRETGHWPAQLDDLVPKYLSAVPRDPCDLQPLRLAHRPDGIVIYSVGLDGKGDGGAIASDGAAIPTDVGLRLWDVDKRRQPPLPPKPGRKP
jgi:hypothetical protein